MQWRRLIGAIEWRKLIEDRKVFISLITLLICAVLLGASYSRGIKRGLDAAVSWTYFYETGAYAVAISDLVYGINLGYVAAGPVWTKVSEIINYHRREEGTVESRVYNKSVINKFLHEAATLPNVTKSGFVDDGGVKDLYFNDLGLVDYSKLAFRLFGIKIESLYKLFFLLIGVSSVCFIFTFRGEIFPSAAIIMINYGFFSQINSDVFDPHMPTVYGLRYGIVLAIIPTLHLLLLLLNRVPLSKGALAMAIPQVLSLILAIKLRSSAQWGLMAIGFIAALQLIETLWIQWKNEADRRLVAYETVRTLVRWPLVCIVGFVLLHGAYMRAALHPIYDADDVSPQHVVWHTMWMNYAPFFPSALAMVPPGTSGDNIGYLAGLTYARSMHYFNKPESLASPLTNTTMRYALYDRLMRRLYFAHVAQNPIGAAHLYMVIRPLHHLRMYWNYTSRLYPGWTHALRYILGAGFLIALFFTPWSYAQARAFALASLASAAACSIPQMAMGPAAIYMVDPMIVWPVAIYIGLPALALGLFGLGRQWWHGGRSAEDARADAVASLGLRAK